MAEHIESGFIVGEGLLGDRTCEHLAFRTAEIDAQLWFETGDRPLPCRIVLTYKRALGSPQFWAQFHDWDLSDDPSDEIFQFTPAKGAEQLTLQAVVREIRKDAEGM